MKDKTFVEKRREAKKELLEFMGQNKDVQESKCIALFSLRTGYSIKRITEYLDELKQAGVI